MWRVVRMAAAAAVLGLSTLTANADTITTFDISGTYTTYAGYSGTEDGGLYPSGGPFSGSLSVDFTSATVVSANLGVPEVGVYLIPPYNTLVGTDGIYAVGPLIGDGALESELSLVLVPSGNGSYSGGTIEGGPFRPLAGVISSCPANPAPCEDATFDFDGVLTATPLPSALPLAATGLGAIGLLGWRRKRKNAVALAAA